MKYSQCKVCECQHTKGAHNYSLATKTRPTGYKHCNGIDCNCENFVPLVKAKNTDSPHAQYRKPTR